MYDPAPPIQAEFAMPPRTSNKAVISLVLGIASFVCACLAGIPAIVFGIIAIHDVNRSRGTLTGKRMAIVGVICGGIASVLTIPLLIAASIFSHRDIIQAVRRVQMNRLKTIGEAIKSFETTNGAYPADSHDAAGKPLLSWRVHILPQLDEQDLYSQFHLDEPWNSPHNRSLISKMPNVYAISVGSGPTRSQTTRFLAVVENGAPFDGTPGNDRGVRKGPKQDIEQGGHAIMVAAVEADDEVEWTKPADLAGKQALASAVGMRFLVLYADGFVELVSGTDDPRPAKDRRRGDLFDATGRTRLQEMNLR
jgi:hypothetical protein